MEKDGIKVTSPKQSERKTWRGTYCDFFKAKGDNLLDIRRVSLHNDPSKNDIREAAESQRLNRKFAEPTIQGYLDNLEQDLSQTQKFLL